MKRVIKILMENAISFTPDGGTIKVSLCLERGNVCLQIVDQGTGIDENLLPNIFQEFSIIDLEKQSAQDQGVSLAFAQQILHAHNGKIIAENRWS